MFVSMPDTPIPVLKRVMFLGSNELQKPLTDANRMATKIPVSIRKITIVV